jgi:hypothetical protein
MDGRKKYAVVSLKHMCDVRFGPKCAEGCFGEKRTSDAQLRSVAQYFALSVASRFPVADAWDSPQTHRLEDQ